jgi:hypothetical protein
MANRSHKVIFDANDRFISEADVRITTASVSNAHKVIIASLTVNDRNGG